MSRLLSIALISGSLAAPALADGHALRGSETSTAPLATICGVVTTITRENGVRMMRSRQDPACVAAAQARAAAPVQAAPQTSVTVNLTVNEDAYGARRLPRKVPFYERFWGDRAD